MGGGEGGGNISEKRGMNDGTTGPLQGKRQCMARGAGWVCGGGGGVPFLDSKSGAEFIFPRKRAPRPGRQGARRSPTLGQLLVPRTHVHILKRERKKRLSDPVHVFPQSHALPWPTKRCNSPLPRLRPQRNNKARPSSFYHPTCARNP